MQEIFKAIPVPNIGCGHHQGVSKEMRKYLSCSCSLIDSGAYMIVWDGPGLGLICKDEEDGERKAHMMNVAWDLAIEAYTKAIEDKEEF